MRLLKRFLFALFLTLLFLGTVNIVRAAEPERTVKVGTYDNYPKIYQDANGVTSGVFADILNFIAERENWKLEYVYGFWEEGLSRLEKGEIDLMVDVAVSEEREKRFDFTSETVLNSWGVIYVQKNSTIDSLLDLEGKKISILGSSVYEGGREGIDAYLKAFGINAVLVEVDDYADAINFLDLGVVDAAIVSRVFSLANQGDYPNLKPTNIFLKPTEIKFALTKGDSDDQYLIARLDYWIKKLRDDNYEDFYHQTLKKHGLQGLDPQTEKQTTTLPSWVLPALLGAGTGFLATQLVTILQGRIRKKGKSRK